MTVCDPTDENMSNLADILVVKRITPSIVPNELRRKMGSKLFHSQALEVKRLFFVLCVRACVHYFLDFLFSS